MHQTRILADDSRRSPKKMKTRRSQVKTLWFWAVIGALIVIGPYSCNKIFQLLDKPGIQRITGFPWPKGTKVLQWQYSGGLQSSWVKVHLQLPASFRCDATRFTRFDPAYTNEYNPATTDERRWDRQRQIWNAKEGRIGTFDSLNMRPVASSNLFFSASSTWAGCIPWELVYDEASNQMWVFCY